ncbi:MAG TPA: hypothetical protein VK009_14540 [Chloroflexota bacterium]|nr:hypothetical protein [Chloroflexota bacterium]
MVNNSRFLRFSVLVDAAIFFVTSALNLGVHMPLGFTSIGFPAPAVQAGVGELIIGAALLLAAVVRDRSAYWTALALSGIGIAFGLRFSRSGSPQLAIHLVLLALGLLSLGLLVWSELSAPRGASRGERPAICPLPKDVVGLMALAAVTLFVASAIHLNLTPISDPFGGAAVPEAVLGAALAIGGAAGTTGWSGSRRLATTTTLITMAGDLYGLSTSARSPHAGDIVYHVALLLLLGVIAGLLLWRPRRRALAGA